MKKFNQWVSSIADAGRELLSRGASNNRKDKNGSLAELCSQLCTSKGEAMGTAIAHGVVKSYQGLNQEEQLDFFRLLLIDYSVDPQAILRCADEYREKGDQVSYRALSKAVEAPRQNLFRRINMAPEGTVTLIKMRQDLIALLPDNENLKGIDTDLRHLLISWFNRGFLSLEQICWNTPAQILEKLIAYEAVHAMSGWDDLRRRLADDRRCFAFFHPALDNEPLIFVEVALTKGIAGNVQELLAKPDEDGSENDNNHDDFDTAIFYSISNCQEGLKGISFGNFLIKQVVVELRKELPQLTQFATLSPIPGFRRWLKKQLAESNTDLINSADRKLLQLLDSTEWHKDEKLAESLKPVLMRLCAHYLYHAKRGTQPMDPVSRFHLGNGACIAHLNWLGDISENGMAQSAGILVNYAYKLDQVEENHEDFVNEGVVAISSDFQRLIK